MPPPPEISFTLSGTFLWELLSACAIEVANETTCSSAIIPTPRESQRKELLRTLSDQQKLELLALICLSRNAGIASFQDAYKQALSEERREWKLLDISPNRLGRYIVDGLLIKNGGVK